MPFFTRKPHRKKPRKVRASPPAQVESVKSAASSTRGPETGMAPALTKVPKDGHGVHLSSLPVCVRMDFDRRPVHSTELDPRMRLTHGDLQNMWNNLSYFASLDSCLPTSLLDVSADDGLSPCLQESASNCKTVLLPSPASLFSLLSINNGLRDSHQVVPILPGVPDMFLSLVPEHNSQEACSLQGCGDASECGPDGGDVMCHSSFIHASVSSSYSLGEVYSQGYTPLSAPPPTMIQEKGADMARISPAPMQRCSARMNFDHLASSAVLEEALKEQLSRQAGLHSRALKLQKRLQALLGEHTLLHCSQQLEGLKRHRLPEDVSLDSLDSTHPAALPPQPGSNPRFSRLELSTASSPLTELREFSCTSQSVLRSLQEALDSEATASSSSEDESQEDKSHVKTRASPVCFERQWLEERAELGSRWSWLQLRLVDLEGRILQLVELHKHIRSSKGGGVVLAGSQPLTDRQIQQNLLREMGGLPCTDADTEACSPACLLHNIERQSAQLNHIVNSLMPPLSFSPLSKRSQTWKEKRISKSGQKADSIFEHGSSKRRRVGNKRFFKADLSRVCARTRPLVTYHKPRLFTFNSHKPRPPQVSGQSTFTFSSPLSPSSCSCRSSCDPVVLYSEADCSSSWALSSRNPSSRPHPMSLSFDTALSRHLQRSQATEDWFLKPLVINAPSPVSAHYSRYTSTSLHNSHKYKKTARHHKRKVMGLSPLRGLDSVKSKHRRAKPRKKKRKHIERLKDEEDNLLQLWDLQESSDEALEGSYRQVPQNKAAQHFVRKRQGENVYNINNIFIPTSVATVEKLQYKDIVTPSWRTVDTHSLTENEAERGKDRWQGQVEDLSDEVFAQRHLTLEQGEKLHWSFWGKRKCCRRPKRSGSRLSGSGGAMCTSGEESSVEWSSAQLDTDEQASSEEWLLPAPWEPRLFPLGEDEEEALLSENLENIPSERALTLFNKISSLLGP
ncbi:hypothetical protein Q5P01_013392 [Channa striata]|uniref:PEHE domain-containing protein n=1 Tax=Channa striata TaxID=64152 RepID=A0AA88SHP8_CHASR|nr:hypothetical protein Q5P01_013392 [Channa striata]